MIYDIWWCFCFDWLYFLRVGERPVEVCSSAAHVIPLAGQRHVMRTNCNTIIKTCDKIEIGRITHMGPWYNNHLEFSIVALPRQRCTLPRQRCTLSTQGLRVPRLGDGGVVVLWYHWSANLRDAYNLGWHLCTPHWPWRVTLLYSDDRSCRLLHNVPVSDEELILWITWV